MSNETSARRAIASRTEFTDAARQQLLHVDATPVRSIAVVDVDFSPWPLDDADIVIALTRWIRLPGRRLRLVGSRFDVIERDQSRFAHWRKPFAHAIECLTPTDVDPTDMPCLMLMDTGCLELLDRERWQARWSSERRTMALQRERLDALVQRCEAAWPVTVLGL